MCIDGAENGCCVFKHPLWYAGMATMFIGFVTSAFGIFSFFGLLFYLTPFIIFASSGCCAMSKCGFITGGVLATISGVLGLLAALGITNLFAYFSFFVTAVACADVGVVSPTDDFYYYGGVQDTGCDVDSLFLIYGIASGLWLIASILFFIFACCGPHDRIAQELTAKEATQMSNQPIGYPNSVPQSNGMMYQAQPGFQPMVQQGYQPGVQQGFQPGAQQGFQPGVQQGFQPGVQQGVQPGVQPTHAPAPQPPKDDEEA